MGFSYLNYKNIGFCITVACVLASVGFVFHDEKYPQDYFSLPVNRQVQLSGTFGELRSNHFHSGLDIKSKDGGVGEPILAAAQGFISRISVQAGGYGNALYLAHPNGYTTVYAHLDHFPPDVKAYVKAMQYSLQRFAVNLYPTPNQFVFQKGEVIAYLGNSGGSSGPHVHFEIRRTSDQSPINPLLFGLKVVDRTRPSMRTLKVYEFDEQLFQFDETDHPLVFLAPGKYQLRDTLFEATQHVGFALKVYDQMTGAPNLNGIYGLNMSIDDVPQYHFKMDRIPFSLTRFLNAHIDYAARMNHKGFFHRCFRLPGNALEIYTEEQERGVIQLFEDKTRKVEIRASDVDGNVSSLVFYIRRRGDIATPSYSEFNHEINYLESARINSPECTISFEPHTFYQNIKLQVSSSDKVEPGFYARAQQISPADIPVHRYYDMKIQATHLPETLRPKAFIARIDDGEVINCGGTINGTWLHSRVRSLGTFSIAVDTIAPEIVPIIFRPDMAGRSKMQFRIRDNQAVEGQADDISFTATVDGKWILMEYDTKRAMLTHWFDEHILPGTHELILEVRDDRGNVHILSRMFSR